MKAMILAAGFGTRPLPLTDKRPKALMPVANKPVIARVIEYLKTHGITRIVVNAHHHYQQVLDYLVDGGPFGLEIEVRVEPEILGTGGGIKNTFDFWDDDPFVVINSDILTDIDLTDAYEHHIKSGAPVTLVLHDCEPYNQIQIDSNQQILDIAPERQPDAFAFTGIHIMNPELLSCLPEKPYSDIIKCYRNLIRSGKSTGAYISEGHYWRDIGDIDSYMDANKEFAVENFSIAPGCHIDPSAKLEAWAVVGENTCLEKNAVVRRSILWEDVRVREGTKVVDSIVTASKVVERNLAKKIL